MCFFSFIISNLFLKVSDGIGENTFSEISIHVFATAALCFDQISRNIKETPDLEGAVDQRERAYSESVDKSADWDVVDEDENPEKNWRVEDVMQNLSTDEEGARAITNTESYHLDEGQNHCEDVKLRDKDLDEGDEQERDNDDPLSFHHEGTATVFFKELSREESDSHLEKVQIDEDWKNVFGIASGNWNKRNVSTEVAKCGSSWELVEENYSACHQKTPIVGFCNRVKESSFLSCYILIGESFGLFELFNGDIFINKVKVMLQSLVIFIFDHAFNAFITEFIKIYG